MGIDITLENYLKSEIFPQVASPPYGKIESTRISHQRPVYLYHDESSQAKIVGKYFQYGSFDNEEAWHNAEKEYFNLNLLRNQVGMKDDHYNIVAPLGRNKVLSALLILDRVPGQTLDSYIARAIFENQSHELFYKLSDLARFFVRLHSHSDSGKPVSTRLPQWYLDVMLQALQDNMTISWDQRQEIKSLSADWWDREGIFNDHEVIVHGDATPTNFLFHHQKVTGIDLEKMKCADRCWDLGFIAAELKHHYAWRTGEGLKAEPFIGHFLWEYATAFGDTGIFYRITRKLPLYMSLGLLRIARNNWLDVKYRQKLVGEAKLCLKFRP